jgi:hypothetical protein
MGRINIATLSDIYGNKDSDDRNRSLVETLFLTFKLMLFKLLSVELLNDNVFVCGVKEKKQKLKTGKANTQFDEGCSRKNY